MNFLNPGVPCPYIVSTAAGHCELQRRDEQIHKLISNLKAYVS
jgi:hypothetical protein